MLDYFLQTTPLPPELTSNGEEGFFPLLRLCALLYHGPGASLSGLDFEFFLVEYITYRFKRLVRRGDDQTLDATTAWSFLSVYQQYIVGQEPVIIDDDLWARLAMETWERGPTRGFPMRPDFPSRMRVHFSMWIEPLIRAWLAEVRLVDFSRSIDGEFHGSWIRRSKLKFGESEVETVSSTYVAKAPTHFRPQESSLVQLETYIMALAHRRAGTSNDTVKLPLPCSEAALSHWVIRISQSSALRRACCDLSQRASQFLLSVVAWLLLINGVQHRDRLHVVNFLLDLTTWSFQTPEIISKSLPSPGSKRVTSIPAPPENPSDVQEIIYRVASQNHLYGLARWHFLNKIRRGFISHWSLPPHPNILPLLSVNVVENYRDKPSSVAPYYRECKNYLATLTVFDRLNAILDIAKAVDHLHQNGVVHGNLHWNNIIFGDARRVSLTDIGTIPIRFHVVGKIRRDSYRLYEAFAAPELPRRSSQIDSFVIQPSADVYSMSMLFLFLLLPIAPNGQPSPDFYQLSKKLRVGVEALPGVLAVQEPAEVIQTIWDLMQNMTLRSDLRPTSTEVLHQLQPLCQFCNLRNK